MFNFLPQRRIGSLAPPQMSAMPLTNSYTNPVNALAPVSDQLAQQTDQQQQSQQPSQQQSDQPDINGRFSALANTPTPAYDEYIKQTLNPPNPDEYRPSRTRKVLAGLSVLSGNPAAPDYVLNRPMDVAQKDYLQRTGVLGQGAKQEEAMINNKRGIAVAEASNDLNTWRTSIQAKKENDIFNTKMEDMQRKENEFNQRLSYLNDEAARKQGDFESQLKLRDQANNIMRARMGLMNDMNQMRLSEQQRLHDMQAAHWDNQDTNATDVTAIRKEAEARKAAGQDITRMYTFNMRGNVTGYNTSYKPKTSELGTISTAQNVAEDNDLATKAKAYLTKSGKPVTDANVKYLVDHKGQW